MLLIQSKWKDFLKIKTAPSLEGTSAMMLDPGALNVDPKIFRFKGDLESIDPAYVAFIRSELSRLLDVYMVFFNPEIGINTAAAKTTSLTNLIKTVYACADIHHDDPKRRNTDEPFAAHVIRAAMLNVESFYPLGPSSDDPLEEILQRHLVDPRFASTYWSMALFSPFPALIHDGPETIMERTGKTKQQAIAESLQILRGYGVRNSAISILSPIVYGLTKDENFYRDYLAKLVAHPSELTTEQHFVCEWRALTKVSDADNNTDMKINDEVWRRLRRGVKNFALLNVLKEYLLEYRELVGDGISPLYIPVVKNIRALAIRTRAECSRIGDECRKTIDRTIANLSPINTEGNGHEGQTDLEYAISSRRGVNIFGLIDYVLEGYIQHASLAWMAEEPGRSEEISERLRNLIIRDTSYYPKPWFPIFSGALLTRAREMDIPSERLAKTYRHLTEMKNAVLSNDPFDGPQDELILYAYQTYAQAKLIGNLCTRIAEMDSSFYVKHFNAQIPDTLAI